MTKIIVVYSSMCKVGGDNVVHFFFLLHYPIAGKIGSHSFLLFDIWRVPQKVVELCVYWKAILVYFP